MNNKKDSAKKTAGEVKREAHCPAKACFQISKEAPQTSSLDTPAHTFGVRG